MKSKERVIKKRSYNKIIISNIASKLTDAIPYLFVSFIGWFVVNSILAPHHSQYNNVMLPIFAAACLIIHLLIKAYKKRLAYISRIPDKYLVPVIAIVLFLIHTFVGYSLMAPQELFTWDAAGVYQLSSDYVLNGARNLEYLSIYPNNIGLFSLEVIYFKFLHDVVGIVDFTFYVVLLNVVIMQLTVWILFFLCKHIIGRKAAYISLLFSVLFIVFSLHTRTFYTDTIGMLFPVVAILLYAHMHSPSNKKRLILAALMGFVLMLGFMMKPTVAIVLIAVIALEIVLIIVEWQKRFPRVRVVSLLVTVLVFTGLTGAVNTLTREKLDLNENASTPLSHFLHMGVMSWGPCEEFTVGDCLYGGWNADAVKERASYGLDQRPYAPVALRNSVEQVKEYGVGGYVSFLTSKGAWIIGDGTFFAYKEGSEALAHPAADNTGSTFVQEVLFHSGKYYKGAVIILQTMWVVILLLTLLPLLLYRHRRSLPNQTQKNVINAVYLALFGQVLFLILFEGRSRYLVLFIPLFIFSAVYGLNQLSYLKKSTIQNQQKPPK